MMTKRISDFYTDNVSATSSFGKRFSDDVENASEKKARIAKESIRDLMLFNNELESELHKLMMAMDKGQEVDHELIDKMTAAKEKYNYAMSGFKSFDDEMQRYALTSLADAIQDLMFHLHQGKRH